MKLPGEFESSSPGASANPLKVLFVEDNPGDVRLMVEILKQAGYGVAFDVAGTPEALQRQIEQGEPEVIISDHNLCGWTGVDALETLNRSGKDIPFIVVSGILSDEAAVAFVKLGASDYVIKDRLARLPSAVQHALEEKSLRQQRQHAEEALRQSEERYRLLFEANPHPMWIYDTETLRFLAVNDAAMNRYGYSREEFLERKITDIRAAENTPDRLYDPAIRDSAYRQGGIQKHRKKDGTLLHVEIASHALPFGKGNTRLVSANDISERMTLEEQFRQAQKMEAVGRLAGGVAHDFNNCLNIIMGYCDLMLEEMDGNSPLRRHGEMIRAAGLRAAGLTQQLLAFSRNQVFQPRILDLNTVVSELAKMMGTLIGEDIEVVLRLDSSLGRIQADPAQIDQVLMNLAVNARDAMPQGGKMVIETGNVELDEMYAQGHFPVRPGRYAMLSLTDTGIGMNKEIQAKIFEPFFTTKEKGKGTGLGLATVYGIVKQSGGYIWVYSEPGRGTTFKVYLPQVEQPTKAAEPDKAAVPAARGLQTVLVVEDDGPLRQLYCEFLRTSGYEVLEASNGAEAVEVAEQYPGPIHLLMTDTVMPGLRAWELSERLLAKRPATRVLYVSGYTDDTVLRHGVSCEGKAFLQKPFPKSELIAKVRELLEG